MVKRPEFGPTMGINPETINRYTSAAGGDTDPRNVAMMQGMMDKPAWAPSITDHGGGVRTIGLSPNSAQLLPNGEPRPAVPTTFARLLAEKAAAEAAGDTARVNMYAQELARRAGSGNNQALESYIGGGGPPAGGAGGTARPQTRAERDALPVGTSYVGPDGKIYVKQ